MQNHAMVIQSDARAMGATTALRRGKRYGQKPSMSDYRTGSRASDCVSYRLDDDGNKVGAHIFAPTRTRKPNRDRVTRVIIAQTNDISLMAKMGTIHSEAA
jgi:hypothetical protein